MKLSQNMLNFLGYLYEQAKLYDDYVCDRSTAIALAYPFGVTSALKNNLIKERGPYNLCLTYIGIEIGKIGSDMRKYLGPPTMNAGWIAHAQVLLDSGILLSRDNHLQEPAPSGTKCANRFG